MLWARRRQRFLRAIAARGHQRHDQRNGQATPVTQTCLRDQRTERRQARPQRTNRCAAADCCTRFQPQRAGPVENATRTVNNSCAAGGNVKMTAASYAMTATRIVGDFSKRDLFPATAARGPPVLFLPVACSVSKTLLRSPAEAFLLVSPSATTCVCAALVK